MCQPVTGFSVSGEGGAPPAILLVVAAGGIEARLYPALLAALGFACLATQDAGEAVALAADPGAHGVIIDMDVPGIDGNDLAARLRAGGGTAIPIIGVSNHVEDRMRIAGARAGFTRVLPRPVSMQDLEAIFRPRDLNGG